MFTFHQLLRPFKLCAIDMSDLQQKTPESEDNLSKRIRSGDQEALAELLHSHREPMIVFIKSITSERLRAVVEADDLYQEVSTTALAGLATAPLVEYTPMQWLQQIARRRVIDAHRFHFGAKRRDAGRQVSMHAGGERDSPGGGLEAWIAASMTSPTAALSRDIRLSRLHEVISQLPEEQQTVVRMRYIDGKPTKQIAEAIGKTDVAVRVLLSRTIRSLEQQLSDVRPTPR
jgi:RNA polymerase sigma-70 factor, ECF subfamily